MIEGGAVVVGMGVESSLVIVVVSVRVASAGSGKGRYLKSDIVMEFASGEVVFGVGSGEGIARLGWFCEQTRRARPQSVVLVNYYPSLKALRLFFLK